MRLVIFRQVGEHDLFRQRHPHFLGTLEGTFAGTPFAGRMRCTRTWVHTASAVRAAVTRENGLRGRRSGTLGPMNDQQAGIVRPEHGHRPGGQTMSAQPDASGDRPPGARTERLPRTDRTLRTDRLSRAGRLHGKPMVAALVGLAVAISGCAASSSATSPSAAVPAAAGQTATRP
ncbi:hypothetical protein AB0J28_38825, partial [Streptosporangium canum]